MAGWRETNTGLRHIQLCINFPLSDTGYAARRNSVLGGSPAKAPPGHTRLGCLASLEQGHDLGGHFTRTLTSSAHLNSTSSVRAAWLSCVRKFQQDGIGRQTSYNCRRPGYVRRILPIYKHSHTQVVWGLPQDLCYARKVLNLRYSMLLSRHRRRKKSFKLHMELAGRASPPMNATSPRKPRSQKPLRR
jgi:hypothetical protein